MAAVEIEKIPALTGREAQKFIEAVKNPAPVKVTEQQRKIYAAFKSQKG